MSATIERNKTKILGRNQRSTDGFTLVELMIVVAIIGILASVAMPAYNDYVIRGQLQEATSALSNGRIKLEQFFQDNRTYAGSSSPCPAATTSFTYACSDLGTTTYTITATGTSSVSDFKFTIDQSNTKKTTGLKSGWGTAPQNCWITKRGASC